MTRFLTATAIGMVLAGAAIAQTATPAAPPAPPAAPSVGKVMVRSEVQTMVRDHFARMDANKDGAITKAEIAELKAHRSSMAGEHLRKGHHAMRDPAVAFDRIDTNKDGSISRDEFAKGREVRIEKRIVMREGGAGADAKPGVRREMRMRHMGGGMGMGGHMIVMADTDKDGRITLAEAEAMALQHFDKMDANKDGQVTPEERRAGRMMIMKMMMAPKAG
jgi:Ca2+-binding EF-hand superfamily protein